MPGSGQDCRHWTGACFALLVLIPIDPVLIWVIWISTNVWSRACCRPGQKATQRCGRGCAARLPRREARRIQMCFKDCHFVARLSIAFKVGADQGLSQGSINLLPNPAGNLTTARVRNYLIIPILSIYSLSTN
jgi:hypothetical protein